MIITKNQERGELIKTELQGFVLRMKQNIEYCLDIFNNSNTFHT